ncbi:DASH family cryptochrome [Confluentibacter lentus]|uniref:DASH family cryptochrome n=1 Tax=Confluentibacter lentus TaxID=1699412 RepID=UPI000C28E971|nr:DASH family cryptochrome [Confluentibacter lentus]
MQETQNKNVLIWFRNDLRIHDNAVLQSAINASQNVIALYCFDPRHYETTPFGFKKTEKFRAKFLIETVSDLKTQLAKLNISLLVCVEKPEIIIPEIIIKLSVDSVYLQKEWTSEEVDVLEQVKKASPKHVDFKEVYNQFLFHPDDVPFSSSEIPEVFTVFRKKVETSVAVRASLQITECLENQMPLLDIKVPTLHDLGFEAFEMHPKTAFPFQGGETSALKHLQSYLFESKKVGFYKLTRNGLIGVDYSSKCSPWLANGSLSARTIYWEMKRFEQEHVKNESTYWLIFELIWRDYFKYISMKHQNNIFKIGGILQKEYEWKTNKQYVQQWMDGNTKEPFVNANMIELKKTGWMSNRGRQNVASYFAKDMLMDWRMGAAYFESMLIDYDVHSNYGNWMYVSGVGNDPRDRKFNIPLQAKNYDGNGTYQKLWLQNSLFE